MDIKDFLDALYEQEPIKTPFEINNPKEWWYVINEMDEDNVKPLAVSFLYLLGINTKKDPEKAKETLKAGYYKYKTKQLYDACVKQKIEVVICAINTSTNLNIIKSNKPRMFEVADYISELALLERKCKDGLLNRSELAFFDKKELRNKYLKPYQKKIKI